MNEPAGTYVEWCVHGRPGSGYPPYEYVWSRRIQPDKSDVELESLARAFVESVRNGPGRSGGIRTPWADGPHLSKRTVVVAEWVPDAPA